MDKEIRIEEKEVDEELVEAGDEDNDESFSLEEKQVQHDADESSNCCGSKPDAPKQHNSEQNSSKYVLYSILVLIILVIGLVYYNQQFVSSRVEEFQDTITGRDVKALVEDNYFYNGIEFKLIDGLWYFTLHSDITQRDYNIPLHYGPREAADVPLIGSLNEDFVNDEQVFITFDPEEGVTSRQSFITLAAAELSLNLKQAINRKPVAACTQNITYGCFSREIISCDNTDRAVIYIKYDDNDDSKAKVELKGNCVVVSGKDKDLTKAVDRLLLYWYDVLE